MDNRDRFLREAPRLIVDRAVRRVRNNLSEMLTDIAPYEIGVEDRINKIASKIVNDMEELTRLVR